MYDDVGMCVWGVCVCVCVCVSDVVPSISSLVVEAPVTPYPSTSSSIPLPDPLPPSTPKSSQFPSNFSIHSHWRPSIMKAIATEKLTKDICNEICHDNSHVWFCAWINLLQSFVPLWFSNSS